MPPPRAGRPHAENLAGEAPGTGHRGFELHGQVVIDVDRPDLDPVQNHEHVVRVGHVQHVLGVKGQRVDLVALRARDVEDIDGALHDDDKFLSLAKVHDEMIRAYRAVDWATASEKLAGCREHGSDLPLAKLYDIYAERLASPPVVTDAAQWDGIYEAREK